MTGCIEHAGMPAFGCRNCDTATRVSVSVKAAAKIELGEVLDLLDAWSAQQTRVDLFRFSYRNESGATVSIEICRAPHAIPKNSGKGE